MAINYYDKVDQAEHIAMYNAMVTAGRITAGSGSGVSLVQAAAMAPYIGQVATHATTATATSAANFQANSRSYHVADVDLASTQLVFDNWYGPSETGPGAATTITASIEYPAGTFSQVTFKNSTSGTIPNGGRIVSDPCYVAIPSGAAFFVRSFVSNTAGIVYTQNARLASQGMGESYAFAASGLSDQTMSGTITPVSIGTLYTPSAIIGLTTQPTILILGDSRASGQGEASGTAGTTETGCISRNLFPTVAFIKASMGGMTAAQMVANNTMRRGLAAYVSHVICQYGTNDLALNGSTAAQVVALLQTIRGYFPSKKFYQTTIYVRGTSTDGWATLVNQTPLASEPQRVLLNASIRAGISGFTGYIEMADQFESARDSGKWAVTGVANVYTTDGVHGNEAINGIAAASNAITPSIFTRY